MKQKFEIGDLVRIAKDLGPSMSHFTADEDAIVLGSYADQYGGQNTESYTIYINGSGRHSWYDEHQLTLIEHGRMDLRRKWETEAEELAKKESDLDWIFERGGKVLEECSGATVAALASCLGVGSLWGVNGEGITFYTRARQTLALAKPFLEKNDKEGWLDFCDGVEITRQ